MKPMQAPTAPPWTTVQTLAELLADLTWSGTQPVPAIGARVRVHMNGFGPALVNGYFHAEDYLGVVCASDQLPVWFQQQRPDVQECHFFGRELEAFWPVPAGAATPDQTRQFGRAMAEQVARGEHGLSQAGDANAEVPVPLTTGDWIPDYPPCGNDGLG